MAKLHNQYRLSFLTRICINADRGAAVRIGNLTVANGMVSKEFLNRRGVNAQMDEQRFSTGNEEYFDLIPKTTDIFEE